MNLCSSLIATNPKCGSISGGIKSIEFLEIDDYIKTIPKSAGNAVTYYYRRGGVFFFRNDKMEVFKLITAPFEKESLLPQLKRGQRFMLSLK